MAGTELSSEVLLKALALVRAVQGRPASTPIDARSWGFES